MFSNTKSESIVFLGDSGVAQVACDIGSPTIRVAGSNLSPDTEVSDMPEWLLLVLKELVIPLVALVLTPIVVGLVNRAIQAFERRTDLEFTKAQEQQFEKIAREAVHFAEEQSSKAASGEKSDFGKMSGKEKMEAALSYAEKRLKSTGLNKKLDQGADHLAEIIESKLFEERLKHGDKESPAPKGETSLSKLDISNRVHNELEGADINSVEQLQEKSDDELKAIKGIGDTLLQEIKKALDQYQSSGEDG